MGDPLESPKLCLSYARDDIQDLDNKFEAFFMSNPYTKVIEHDLKAGMDVHKVKLTKQLPARISHLANRIAVEMRSALDQCGYAIAKASGNTRLKGTYFPFARTASELDDVVSRRCKDLPPEISAFFRSFNAHKGGDDLLWSLNELANCHKHRFIMPVAHGNVGTHFKNLSVRGSFAIPNQAWNTEKNEIEIFRASHGSETKYDIDLAFYVAFGDIGAVKGAPVLTVLLDLANRVQEIIGATETEARRIGLVP